MKKKQLHELCIFILSINFVVFSGCASKPKFKGKGDLCGLIIDENNKPVKDFVVYCQSDDATLEFVKPVLTNESGLFVFYDIPSGSYLISGEKNNYQKISRVQYRFDDRTKILCLQTKNFKAALLSVEELIKLGRTEDAENLLNEICCESDSLENQLIQACQFFVTDKARKKKTLISHLKKYKGKENEFINEYAEKLEEVIK